MTMTMTMKMNKYTLEDFNNITFNGFKFDFPEDTLKIISELSLEVGSPNYVKTPIFQKRVNPMKVESALKHKDKDLDAFKNAQPDNSNRKRRGNKSMEILNSDDWESLRTFQTTKIEQKVGLDAQIDLLRSHLNKMSDKNYNDVKNKIIDIIEDIMKGIVDNDEMTKLGTIIFEIASTNRFYSKMYADLYSDLINKFQIMEDIFQNNFNNFMNLFDTIEYVEPNVDYNKFCKINKDNEKRKSLAAFFVNLMNNNIISKDKIVNIVRNLMNKIYLYINQDNKKNEVDELTENIAILYKKELFNGSISYELIDNMSISEIIEKLAHSKSKNYLSLSNKSIFKFMDLIEM
uniref:MIF4G domain-containing protein n=1 Tax=viral metagenome TaxID=1070528 RepID=A0A6C0JFA1_9ZZZZ